MSQSSKVKGKQREPPPALFQGPPSRNASYVEIPQSGTEQHANTSSAAAAPSAAISQRNTLIRQRSQRLPLRSNFDGPVETGPGSALPRSSLPRQQQLAYEGQKQADRTDALWAEMQSTLEEVELSAVNGTHIFGTQHAKALEELRTAQIALAQAWARSEADDVVEPTDKDGKVLKGFGLSSGEVKTSDATEGGKPSNSRPGSSADTEKLAARVADDTETDILLARKRREANDRYFQKVNEGVLEVVAKLEEVAVAMRAVEQESRDIWGESDSLVTSAN